MKDGMNSGAGGPYSGDTAHRLHAHEEVIAPEVLSRLLALFDAGRYAELERQVRDLVKQFPYVGVAWKMLGLALKSQRKDALLPLKKAVELMPNDAQSHCNLAESLRAIGQLESAVSSCRRALLIKPDYAQAYINLGHALRELRQFDTATASAQRALELAPDFALAHHSLGLVLRSQGFLREAEEACQRALEIEADLPEAIMLLAEMQADKGLFADAEKLFQRAIEIDPDSPEAWAGIATVRKMDRSDTDWLAAAERISERVLPPNSEAQLRFAIGKYYDDVGDFEQAFSHFQRANELCKLRGKEYHRQNQTRAVDVLCRIYDSNWIKREQVIGNPSAHPVFIVGMPCSGTSLARQILATHPAVRETGGRTFWKNASDLHAPSVRTGEIDKGTLTKLAEDYLRLLQRGAPDATRVVDEVPENFLHLGLIHAAFPHARILHLQRNPIDTCLSIYFQRADSLHPYANDLEDIAHYYTEYSRAMTHWGANLPEDAILHVPYEELITDQETWVRKMLHFIGLPWDARWMKFHQGMSKDIAADGRPVAQNASAASMQHGRNYQKFIDPLQKLMSLEHPYPYTQGPQGEYGQRERETVDIGQALGEILHRAGLSLQTDLTASESLPFDTAEMRALRIAQMAFSVR